MRIDLFENKYSPSKVSKILFFDIVCFLLVASVAFGLCYAYFSDKVAVAGVASMASMSVDYQDDTSASLTNLYVELNDEDVGVFNNYLVSPGDTLKIGGNVVNTSNVEVYVLAKLEVVNFNAGGELVDTEVIWFNIEDNKTLYVERGISQVGASVLEKDQSVPLSFTYTFEGDRYNLNYSTIRMSLSLNVHQKSHLNLADDYNNYSAVNGYTHESIYATHCIIGRKRDVWESADANVTGLTMDDLQTDSTGAYLINTCKDWMIFSANATQATTTGKTFKLNAYLDFNNDTTSKNINMFCGTFDGQGYTLSNVNIVSTEASVGMFISVRNSSIKNLGLDGFKADYTHNPTTTTWFGSLVAIVYSATIIENCYTIGASTYDNNIPYDINVKASNCNDARIGGLVGNLRGDESENITSIIRDCYTQLNMSVDTFIGYIGGVVGYLYPHNTLINSCYFNGDVNADSTHSGLIVGYSVSNGYTNNCFAITSSFNYAYSDLVILGMATEGYYNNLAYINNTGLTNESEDYNKVVKVGGEQTEKNLTIDAFRSIGELRDAFGWDTSIWSTDIYSGTNGLPVLRAFYNF